MGLPKRLTDQQMKFAYELVTNEGRKTATECAVDSGFAKDSARSYASKLQNPKLYPLVVKYIGELREELQRKYEVTFERHITELAKLREESRKKVHGLQLSMLKLHEEKLRVCILNRR